MASLLTGGALRYRIPRRRSTLSLIAIIDALSNWLDRARQRRDLAALDDAALHDVGLSRADVEREIGKPFWRP